MRLKATAATWAGPAAVGGHLAQLACGADACAVPFALAARWIRRAHAVTTGGIAAAWVVMCGKAITLCGAALRRRADGRCHQHASLIPRRGAARWINTTYRATAVCIGASHRYVCGQAALASDGGYERWGANERCLACAYSVPAGFAAVGVDRRAHRLAALTITAATGVVGNPATTQRTVVRPAHIGWIGTRDPRGGDACVIPLIRTAE